MSQSSSERLREETSSFDLDEFEGDSGHDSVDDMSSPANERERIASLETAVAWIREEVVSFSEITFRFGSCSSPAQKACCFISPQALCVNIVL